MKAKTPELSIIILNYNTKDLTKQCLDSIYKVRNEVNGLQTIVSDNGSTDGSVEMIKQKYWWVDVVENGANLGFAAGNNKARDAALGKYILFLNTDTIVQKDALKSCVEYLKDHKSVGAITCRVELLNGELDKDTRRAFPYPWIALTHIFLKLDKVFPRSKLFARYWYGYIPEDSTHEVDVIQAAFLMSPREVLDKVGWFDEDYFLDGEDVDLCWRIKQSGAKLVYFPQSKIIHLKGYTKGKNKVSKKHVPYKEKIKFRMSGVNSMEIFYRKRMWQENPLVLNLFVILGIKTLKVMRAIRLLFT